MTDRYESHSPSLESPAIHAFAIAPSDGTDVQEVTRAIYVGQAGYINVVMASGSTVTFRGSALWLRLGDQGAPHTAGGNHRHRYCWAHLMRISLSIGSSNRTPWWPASASLAVDFQQNCAARLNTPIPVASIASFARATTAWLEDPAGTYQKFGIDEMRRNARGLWLEPGATNLNPSLAAAGAWTTTAGASQSVINRLFVGLFNQAQSVASGGSVNARTTCPGFPVTAAATYAITLWYAAGSSGRVRLTVNEQGVAGYSHLAGLVAAPAATSDNSKGELALSSVGTMAGGHEARLFWVPNFTGNAMVGLGPDMADTGADVLAFGGQVEAIGHTSPIVTNGIAASRAPDILSIDLPAGSHVPTIIFDSGAELALPAASGAVSIPSDPGGRPMARVVCHPA